MFLKVVWLRNLLFPKDNIRVLIVHVTFWNIFFQPYFLTLALAHCTLAKWRSLRVSEHRMLFLTYVPYPGLPFAWSVFPWVTDLNSSYFSRLSVTASEHSSLLSFPFCIWFWISSSVCPLNPVIVHTPFIYIWLCNSQNYVLLDFVFWASWYCLAQIRCSVTAEFTNELMDQIGEDENLTRGNKAWRHSCRKVCDQDSTETSCARLRKLPPSGM